MEVLRGARRVLFAHAHPDDETLATGALIAHLTGLGVRCTVVTATRGESGEIRPGSFDGDPAGLPARRERELSAALAVLGVGVHQHCFLGQPPALAAGQEPRSYTDSGMVWIREGLAGPAESSGPRSLTRVNESEPLADLMAAIETWHPDVVVTYDDIGGYGHPDHVRLRELCLDAAKLTGVRLVEVVQPDTPGAGVLDLTRELATVAAALRCHATQVRVEGSELVHVGGQREPILVTTALREIVL